MVRLNQNEADVLIKKNLHKKLYKASANKNHGGKTYYCNNDDFDALKIVSQMRNKKINELM